MGDAIDLVMEFFEAHDVSVLTMGNLYWWEELKDVIKFSIPDLRGNDVFDAQIALCLRHNGVKRIWTRDSDFRKYPFLKVIHWIE